MEHFDIGKFEKLPTNPETGLLILENGDETYYLKGANNQGYIERIEKKNTPFTIVKVFHENRSLLTKGEEFYSFRIGSYKEYDDIGNLTKEINYDQDYKFSIYDLAKKMKEEYKIDILKKSPWFKVMRDKIDSVVIYKIMIYINENKYSNTKNFNIDGTTGKIISEKILSYPKE
ncbi:hypothetical protein AR687_17190 [Flavobacteriaceae bacterium CRH]|nr:hypothetical protein AR687_17190 [Flavobacteriaceae bacterium CRH]